MKTLQEIKDEVAREDKYADWETVGEMGVSDWMVDQISRRYATECVKASLERAAENHLWAEDTSITSPNNIVLL